MIVVTGATGQLGRLVIAHLLDRVAPGKIVAAVRDPARAGDLAELGVVVREADYVRPDTLARALAGAEKVLLISSSAVGQRVPQHRAVIDAAVEARVGLLAYTSVLRADASPLSLAAEHAETEAAIRSSGLPWVLLRNGWYSENYAAAAPAALQHGAVIGSAGGGRIASASRDDYAEAAAVVLAGDGHAGKVYELAGDEAYTLGQFAAELARQSSRSIGYVDLPEADYRQALLGAGLPAALAGLIAESDVGASRGGLFDDSHTLSRLIGRPTTSIAMTIEAHLGMG